MSRNLQRVPPKDEPGEHGPDCECSLCNGEQTQPKGRTDRFQSFIESLPGWKMSEAERIKKQNYLRKKARGWSRDPR